VIEMFRAGAGRGRVSRTVAGCGFIRRKEDP